MIRLNLTVEGQTEQIFVARLLAEHLARHGVCLNRPRLTALGKKKGEVHRGGLVRYKPFKKDIHRWLTQDRASDAFFTTMIDLYGLPSDFPGYAAAAGHQDPYARVAKLEEELQADISEPRFIPYIQLHEFEALLLSDPQAFASYYAGCDRQVRALAQVVDAFQNPELVDDGENSAPSKRIGQQFPDYPGRKTAAGPIIAAEIGLDTMRAKCPHFNDWLTKLEGLGSKEPS